MGKYFKLNLNDCMYWQSEAHNGNIIYNKNKHHTKDNDLLNNLFLIKFGNKYVELDSRRVIEFDEEKNVIKPLGVFIPLSNITPCEKSEIVKSYRDIELQGLKEEYRKIINEILVKSKLCEIANNKKLGLEKRY